MWKCNTDCAQATFSKLGGQQMSASLQVASFHHELHFISST